MKTINNNEYPRMGEIWLVNISNAIGHQQGGIRPMLIASNNVGNCHASIFEGIAFTTQRQNNVQPTHANFKAGEAGLQEDSTLLAEQKWPINDYQLLKIIGVMNDDQLLRASAAILISNPFLVAAVEAGVQNTNAFKKVACAC